MTTKNTSVTTQENKPATTTKSLFQQENVQAKFKEILGTKAIGFMTSVLQCTAQNSLLAKAEPNTILQAAMVAATLDLPINNNLGFAYIIPYNEKVKAGAMWRSFNWGIKALSNWHNEAVNSKQYRQPLFMRGN